MQCVVQLWEGAGNLRHLLARVAVLGMALDVAEPVLPWVLSLGVGKTLRPSKGTDGGRSEETGAGRKGTVGSPAVQAVLFCVFRLVPLCSPGHLEFMDVFLPQPNAGWQECTAVATIIVLIKGKTLILLIYEDKERLWLK